MSRGCQVTGRVQRDDQHVAATKIEQLVVLDAGFCTADTVCLIVQLSK